MEISEYMKKYYVKETENMCDDADYIFYYLYSLNEEDIKQLLEDFYIMNIYAENESRLSIKLKKRTVKENGS